MNHSHRAVSELAQNGLQLRHIEAEEEDGPSVGEAGYHEFGHEWWVNLQCPYAFKYLSLDSMYRADYFAGPEHLTHAGFGELYAYMQSVYFSVFNRPFCSALELGTGNGGMTLQLAAAEIDFIAVEGAKAGIDHLLMQGISSDRVLQKNLKFLPDLGRQFDLSICTEVAEHVEPFFASKVVANCITHSEAVWFSAAPRTIRPHYHHINEQPIEAWDNLFAHMGYPYFVVLNGLHIRASRLYFSSRVGDQLASRKIFD